jgi:hypothetical protein
VREDRALAFGEELRERVKFAHATVDGKESLQKRSEAAHKAAHFVINGLRFGRVARARPVARVKKNRRERIWDE